MWLKVGVFIGVVFLFCAPQSRAGFFDLLLNAKIEEKGLKSVPDTVYSAEEAYQRAIEFLSDGRQAEAEDLIASSVKMNRDEIQTLFAKAVLERSRWDKSAARVWFGMIQKAAGNAVLSRAAWLAIRLDAHQNVEENLAELIQLSDKNPTNVFLLWLGAIQCREQTRSGSPFSHSREIALLGKERYQILLTHFRLGPVLLHQTYANILDDLEEYETSLEHRILAVSMEAKGWSLDGLATTLHKLGKEEWSSAVYARVLRRNPSNPTYWGEWGLTLKSMGRYEEAADKYRHALALNPSYAWYWKMLGHCLYAQGDVEDEMFKAYRRAVDLGSLGATSRLAFCYRDGSGVEKNHQKAFELYSIYVEKYSDEGFANENMGDCYSRGIGVEKDFKKALAYYEIALRCDPDSASALNVLAWKLVSSPDQTLHDYPRAVELAERSVEIEAYFQNLDTLAVAYFKNKNYAKAVVAQEDMIAYWQSQHPKGTLSKGMKNRLKKYKKAQRAASGAE